MELNVFIFRILICFTLSTIIGIERQYRHGPVGLRTNVLVALGAFLFNYATYSFLQHDESRIAASIVSGIGFLGAGMSAEDYLGLPQVATVFDSFSVTMTDAKIKTEVLTKVGDLSKYLTSSFANAFHVDPQAITGAFRLNFTQDELQRVVSAMFTKKKSTLATNLAQLGYQSLDDPSHISF